MHYRPGTKRKLLGDRINNKDHRDLHSMKYGNFVPASTSSQPIEKRRILDAIQNQPAIEGIRCHSNEILLW